MQPRICTVKHNPPESYGDCIRACIATMIDRDDVPHVFDGRPPENAWAALRAYLKSIKLTLFVTDILEPFEYMAINNPDIPYMLLCQSGGVNHAIVCRGGEVVHNPAWYKQAVSGPHSQGFYIVGIIGVDS